MSTKVTTDHPTESGVALLYGQEEVITMAKVETSSNYWDFWIVSMLSGKYKGELKIVSVNDLSDFYYYE